MNYSKNLRKAAIAKRVIILACITFFLGLAVGGVSGYALKAHMAAKDRGKGNIHMDEPAGSPTLIYVVYDGGSCLWVKLYGKNSRLRILDELAYALIQGSEAKKIVGHIQGEEYGCSRLWIEWPAQVKKYSTYLGHCIGQAKKRKGVGW